METRHCGTHGEVDHQADEPDVESGVHTVLDPEICRGPDFLLGAASAGRTAHSTGLDVDQ